MEGVGEVRLCAKLAHFGFHFPHVDMPILETAHNGVTDVAFLPKMEQ